MNREDNLTKQNLDAELEWYNNGRFYIDSGHWTSLPLFATRQRHWLSGEIEKIRFYGYLAKYIKNKPFAGKAKVLIAPIGAGNEVKYLHGLAAEITGMDISVKALEQCPSNIVIKKVDILNSKEPSESFDMIICPLFLHHVHKVGMSPFLKEYDRLLKNDGVLAIHEPSMLSPPLSNVSFFEEIYG